MVHTLDTTWAADLVNETIAIHPMRALFCRSVQETTSSNPVAEAHQEQVLFQSWDLLLQPLTGVCE